MKNEIILGDSLEKLKDIESNSIDSIITDPPYELGFMGKKWDNTGIAYNVELWEECLRVLKPGGHLLAFSGTRTYHRMASAIEDAGFEVRDMIEWVYGSGFPKSLNIAKSIESKLKTGSCAKNNFHQLGGKRRDGRIGMYDKVEEYGFRKVNPDQLGAFDLETTTQEAKQWEGWGTALKPAHEPICMARKPLAEKTVAENCLKWGTGGINIDESRVETSDDLSLRYKSSFQEGNSQFVSETATGSGKRMELEEPYGTKLGRFPANIIHDNSEEVRECFPNVGNKSIPIRRTANSGGTGNVYTTTNDNIGNVVGYGDTGNASRFFKSIIYQAKASKSERNRGMDDLEAKPMYKADGSAQSLEIFDSTDGGREDRKNNHPTVKPLKLMEYLIKMVTPKGGIVLDPFAGSGTTLVAAKQNEFQYIGIEMTEEYIPIIKARLNGVK